MNINKDLINITDKSIDYITKLIIDSDIVEGKEELYTVLSAVAALIIDFAGKNLENKKELN